MTNLNIIRTKTLKLNSLSSLSKEIKLTGKKIVFTNGCFDILHKGHVEYLAQAADKGDVLIVGLNSDNSVRKQNKGEDRPINKIDARQTVLASLFFINYIVEFDTETPYDLIKELQPDILVKGGDYDPFESDQKNKKYIVGKDIVEQNGGKVEVINLVDGFSTTGLIDKMKKS